MPSWVWNPAPLRPGGPERGSPGPGGTELARQYGQLWGIFCGALEQCLTADGGGDAAQTWGACPPAPPAALPVSTAGTDSRLPGPGDGGHGPGWGGAAGRFSSFWGRRTAPSPRSPRGRPPHRPGPGAAGGLRPGPLPPAGGKAGPGRAPSSTPSAPSPRRSSDVSWPAQGEGGGESGPPSWWAPSPPSFPSAGDGPSRPVPHALWALAAQDPETRAALDGDAPCQTRFRRLDQAAGWTRAASPLRRWRPCTERKWPCPPPGWTSISPATSPTSSATACRLRTAARRGLTRRPMAASSTSSWSGFSAPFATRVGRPRRRRRPSAPSPPRRWRTTSARSWEGWSTRPPGSATPLPAGAQRPGGGGQRGGGAPGLRLPAHLL